MLISSELENSVAPSWAHSDKSLAISSSGHSTLQRLLSKKNDLSDVDPQRQPAGSFLYVA
jgi:hypothetical protein